MRGRGRASLGREVSVPVPPPSSWAAGGRWTHRGPWTMRNPWLVKEDGWGEGSSGGRKGRVEVRGETTTAPNVVAYIQHPLTFCRLSSPHWKERGHAFSPTEIHRGRRALTPRASDPDVSVGSIVPPPARQHPRPRTRTPTPSILPASLIQADSFASSLLLPHAHLASPSLSIARPRGFLSSPTTSRPLQACTRSRARDRRLRLRRRCASG